MSLVLIRFLAFTLPLAAARPAQCASGSSRGPTACASETSDGEILLHTRSHLAVMDNIEENHEGHRVVELDHLGEAVLYGGSRDSALSLAEQSSKAARQQAWVSYRGTLGKVLGNLETSHQAAVGDLEGAIDKFISEQAGSEDAVSAQLLETKHQLDQLHLHVNDLAMQINATDHEVTALNAQVAAKNEESKILKKKCNEELEEVEKQQKEDLEFLDKLRRELEEMIQIANPDITMNQTEREVNSAGSYKASGKTELAESLLGGELQADALLPFLRKIKIPSAPPRSLKKSQSLVQMHVTQHVHDDGRMTVVKGHGVLTSLKKVMKNAARCVMGGKKVALVGTKQSPSEGPPEEGEGPPEKDDGANEEAKGSNNGGIFAGQPTMPPSKNVQCKRDATAKVEIGGVAGDVSLKRDLEKGETSNVPCVKVNKEYFGLIWLTCNENLEASGAKCLKAENATGCQDELEKLQEVYVKTYVDLSRLVTSYEEKTTDGYEAAKEAIINQCRDRQDPIQTDAAKLAKEASEKIELLEELRPKLEDAQDAYEKLVEQVKNLSEQYKELPETLTDLSKVRDVIKAMSLCPGLEHAKLGVPQWVGSYLDFEEPLGKHSDEEYDVLMREACEKAFGEKYPDQTFRAASVAEMEAHAVLDLPIVNEADTPLIGPCPACEGDEDAGSTSGHKRVCWKSGANLTVEERFKQCSSGKKSIACVIHESKNR